MTQQDVQHFLVVCAAITYALVTLAGLYLGVVGLKKNDDDSIGCGAIGVVMLIIALFVIGYFWYSGLPVTRAQ